MKKWISIGAILLIVLTVVGMITFNNRVEKSQADISEMERGENEKDELIHEEIEKNNNEETSDSDMDTSGEEKDSQDKESNASSEDGQTKADSEETEPSSENKSNARTNDASNEQNPDTSSSQPSQSKNNTSNDNGENHSVRSADAILDEYESEFRSMESEYQGRLNNLVQEAYDEYMQEGTVNEEAYKAEAQSLLSETDSAFYNKYGQLQNELQRNGHSPSEAVPFKSEYENKKEATRADLESFLQ